MNASEHMNIRPIMYVPYSRKYWRGIKFGGSAVCEQTAKLKSANFYYHVIYSLPRHENRQIKIRQFRFSRNPPNIIPANISGYTVRMYNTQRILHSSTISEGLAQACPNTLLEGFCLSSSANTDTVIPEINAWLK